jgi:conjugative transfer signal peptidase TraF
MTILNYLLSNSKTKNLTWSFIAITFLILMEVLSKHIIFNPSISETRGYYFMYKKHDYKKGDMVLVCLKSTRYTKILKEFQLPFDNTDCANNVPYLLKGIVASTDDLIEIKQNVVVVNGRVQKNSLSLNNYHEIKLYPQMDGKFKLKEDNFFVLGLTKHSYDSRYFGVVSRDQIEGVAYLLWSRNKPFFD